MKIAFITAIYGGYEKTCKPFVNQTIESDFICFTDSENIEKNGWIIDNNPYHITHPSIFDNSQKLNSLSNNKHNFNIAKYYKEQFHRIPILQNYDYIIWIDGSIEIKNSDTAKMVVENIRDQPVMSIAHNERNNELFKEIEASMVFDRYTSTFWGGQHQPSQDCYKQYVIYKYAGFKNNSVWVTCFVAWNMKHPKTIPFLDRWYDDHLTLSTQDQVGFSYVAWSLNVQPITIGKGIMYFHDDNIFFRKYTHYQ